MKPTNSLNNLLKTARFQCCVVLLALASSAVYAADTTTTPAPAAKKSGAPATKQTDAKDMNTITAPTEQPESKLKFRIGVPIWASAVSGDVGVKGRTTDAKYISFSGLYEKLDYIVPGSIAVDYGKWGVLVEGEYVKLSETLNTRDILFNSAEVDFEQAFFDFNVSYKVVDTEKLTVAPFIGTRFEYLRLHGQANATPLNPSNRSFDDSVDTCWADPVLGFQASYHIFKPTAIVAKADVGGFGAASKLTYQFFIGQQTQISRDVWLSTGYRYLSTDYTSGGFTYNMAFSGPQITLGFNF